MNGKYEKITTLILYIALIIFVITLLLHMFGLIFFLEYYMETFFPVTVMIWCGELIILAIVSLVEAVYSITLK